MIEAALLDVDGTLVDNNLLHVLAWRRAFQRLGKEVAAIDIVNKIGMGGDQLAPTILGGDEEASKKARDFHGEEYSKKGLIEHTRPLQGATDLLAALRKSGVRIALASSAKKEEIEKYLKLLGGEKVADEIISGAEVQATKPAPDIFERALEALGHPKRVIVIGDTIYDIQAAKKVGLPCVAVLSGGIERRLLEEAGARAIYEDAAAITADLKKVLELG